MALLFTLKAASLADVVRLHVVTCSEGVLVRKEVRDRQEKWWDAELHEWRAFRSSNGAYVLVGRVHHDDLRRFVDGRLIRTSPVISRREDIREGQVVSTINSRYLLRSRAKPGDRLRAFRCCDPGRLRLAGCEGLGALGGMRTSWKA